MKYTLRPYQEEASRSAVEFLTNKKRKGNGLIVASTGSGKSLIIADIAHKLNARVLVFCPSVEILHQNYEKMCSYGVDCSMYSASVKAKEKRVSQITFATIGSVKTKHDMFKDFDYILVDEAHLVNPREGMYRDFLKYVKVKMVGLTATPYRLKSMGKTWDRKEKEYNLEEAYSILVPIVGKRQIFKEVLYNIDTELLLREGYLAKLRYFDLPCRDWHYVRLYKNSVGSEYTDKSILYAMRHTDYHNHLVSILRRLLRPKSGVPRNGILVFAHDLEEAKQLCTEVEGARYVSGEFTAKNRKEVLEAFKNKEFPILVNVACLIVGYDRPDLDTVVLATPTMSLARFYQEVGRALRPFSDKEGWIVDLVGNTKRFGEVHKLKFLCVDGVWDVYSEGKKLTNVKLE